jgi:acyl-coenzyme A synthetase/AMP-(fatty) acid ligase
MLAEVLDTVLPVDDVTVGESTQEPENSDIRAHGASSTNVAYVIFTSGSTGKPKVCSIRILSSTVTVSNILTNIGHHD